MTHKKLSIPNWAHACLHGRPENIVKIEVGRTWNANRFGQHGQYDFSLSLIKYKSGYVQSTYEYISDELIQFVKDNGGEIVYI